MNTHESENCVHYIKKQQSLLRTGRSFKNIICTTPWFIRWWTHIADEPFYSYKMFSNICPCQNAYNLLCEYSNQSQFFVPQVFEGAFLWLWKSSEELPWNVIFELEEGLLLQFSVLLFQTLTNGIRDKLMSSSVMERGPFCSFQRLAGIKCASCPRSYLFKSKPSHKLSTEWGSDTMFPPTVIYLCSTSLANSIVVRPTIVVSSSLHWRSRRFQWATDVAPWTTYQRMQHLQKEKGQSKHSLETNSLPRAHSHSAIKERRAVGGVWAKVCGAKAL